MNFDTYLSDCKAPLSSKGASTFSFCYKYWRNYLLERSSRLFVWKDTDNENKHIELPILVGGICGVMPFKKGERMTMHKTGKLTPFHGYYAGSPTEFYDEWEDFSVHSPIFSGTFKIGKTIAVIKNSSLCNSILPLVHRYAILLGHMEVSLINTLINGRDSGGTPIASTEAQRQAIQNYRDSLCNGKVVPILDPAFSGVRFYGESKTTKLEVLELVEAMRNTLDSYFNDIGVKTSYDKKGNMIEEEVAANDSRVLFNIDDMFESRKRGAEDINKLFDANWSVEKCKELRYDEMEGGNVNGAENDDNSKAVETGSGE